METLLTTEQLQQWTGYKGSTKIVTFLKDNRIPFWTAKGGNPITTLEAVNSRLVSKSADSKEEFDFGSET